MAATHPRRSTAPVPQLSGTTFVCDPPRQLELEHGFEFQHGQRIAPFAIVYETYGRLAPGRDNAILVCHALSPGAHAG